MARLSKENLQRLDELMTEARALVFDDWIEASSVEQREALHAELRGWEKLRDFIHGEESSSSENGETSE